jgi:serine protease AprX
MPRLHSQRFVSVLFRLTASLSLLLPLVSGLAAQSNKLSRELRNTPAGSTMDVLVQFTNAADASRLNSVIAKGGKLKKQFKENKTALYNLPAAAIQALANNSHIQYVTPDRPVRGAMEFANPATGATIARQYGYQGDGVGVAVIDSGVYSHNDFKDAGVSRIVYSQNFVPGLASADDGYGHGTHVAGIVAGNGAMSTGYSFNYTFRGIAPKARIINLRVLDQNGVGTDSAVIAAIDRAIELKSAYNIRVINLSLGRQIMESFTLDPLCQAVERAWKAVSWWLPRRATTVATTQWARTGMRRSPRPATALLRSR